jgi:hypothetical protein
MSDFESFLFKRINDEFFNNSKIAINYEIEGQAILNGQIHLGSKAGPSNNVSNLIHEMCHLVEIDDNRLTAPNWGFKYGTEQSIMGKSFSTYNSIPCIEREIKVWAYQQNLHNLFNIKSTPLEFAKLIVYLGDFPMLAFGEKYQLNSQSKAIEWTESKIIETMKINSIDAFNLEWKRKINLLNEKVF